MKTKEFEQIKELAPVWANGFCKQKKHIYTRKEYEQLLEKYVEATKYSQAFLKQVGDTVGMMCKRCRTKWLQKYANGELD